MVYGWVDVGVRSGAPTAGSGWLRVKKGRLTVLCGGFVVRIAGADVCESTSHLVGSQ